MRLLKLVLIGGGVALGIAVLSQIGDRVRTPQPAPAPAIAPTTQRPPVVGAAMMAVKRFLQDPKSATFPTSDQWTASKLGPGLWRVVGEVTAANGFNARVRQPVVVEMTEDGADMRVTLVKIGEQIAYSATGRAGGR